jgi:uncharacterized membrane protein YphA (DoxX/SURF4 family)
MIKGRVLVMIKNIELGATILRVFLGATFLIHGAAKF